MTIAPQTDTVIPTATLPNLPKYRISRKILATTTYVILSVTQHSVYATQYQARKMSVTSTQIANK